MLTIFKRFQIVLKSHRIFNKIQKKFYFECFGKY